MGAYGVADDEVEEVGFVRRWWLQRDGSKPIRHQVLVAPRHRFGSAKRIADLSDDRDLLGAHSGDTGLDLGDVKLVLIFPDWANADGAVGRIDNVRFVPDAQALELYGDAPAEGWYLWDCCGAGTFAEVDDDPERGRVIELGFGPGGTVTGLHATAGVDASAFAGGTLAFDFKEVSPPPEGSQWRIKLESAGAATAVEHVLTAGGNPVPLAAWQEYRFGLDTEFAGLDLSALTLVLFFPDWERADGAVARIDNVRLEAAR